MREKGGDPDWYGYCVDDPVNRVDAWGLATFPLPIPFGFPVPPVFVPGTSENGRFTKGTLDIFKGIGDFFGEGFGGTETPDDDPNVYSEHTKNSRPSTEQQHQEGQARQKRDQGGEKKNEHPAWKQNQNKKRSDLDSPGDYDMALSDTKEDDEEAA